MVKLRRSPCLLMTVVAGSAAVVAAAVPALAAPPPSATATPTITSGPASGSFVSSTSATLRFTDKTAKATFKCVLDAGTAASCTSPKTYSGLTQGKHTFTVTATGAGKPASSPASRSWTVDTTAPKPAVAAPAGLTSPVTVTFGEAVRATNAKATLATLTLADGGATVPTTTSCWRGTTSVACASALLNTVRLQPTTRLTPGQHYSVGVKAGVVKDRAANANLAASKTFRGARNLQEGAPGVTNTWQTVTSRSAAGGSYVREHLAGAAAAWSFTGSSVTWWTLRGRAQGKAAVYVDGVRKATYDNYATSTHYNVARTISGLSNKSHRLRILVLGVKGSKAGTGTFVVVDAFTVGATKTSSPALVTGWRRFANTHFSGGHASVTDLAGSSLRLTFRGTGLTLLTVKGPNQGKAAVYIDGVRKATFDDYASATGYGVRRVVSNLTDAVHTLKIVVLGKHHTGATGSLVTVDRLLVA